MNKTRIFYPILWAFFIGGVVIGTIIANFTSQQFIQSLGIYRMYSETYLDTFSILDKEWIFYIFINRIKFWIFYLLLSLTSAKLVVTFVGSTTFGCIGAILLVGTTRIYGGFSILLFFTTLFPHYIAYVIAFLFITEISRITTIVPRNIIIEKLVKGSLFWGIGILCEVFMNPTIVYWTIKFLKI